MRDVLPTTDADALARLEAGETLPFWNEDRGTWTVKRSGDYLVEISVMLFNYRIVLTPVSCLDVWDHGWCYFGRDQATLTRALLAATAFDPQTQSAPVGYDKALTTRL